MHIRIDIELGNDAMRQMRDVAHSLRGLANRLEDADSAVTLPIKIRDDNGNTVGQCLLVGDKS